MKGWRQEGEASDADKVDGGDYYCSTTWNQRNAAKAARKAPANSLNGRRDACSTAYELQRLKIICRRAMTVIHSAWCTRQRVPAVPD